MYTKNIYRVLAVVLFIILGISYENTRSNILETFRSTLPVMLSYRGGEVDLRTLFPRITQSSVVQNGSVFSLQVVLTEQDDIVEIIPFRLPYSVEIFSEPVSFSHIQNSLKTKKETSSLGHVNEYGFANPDMPFHKEDPRYLLEQEKRRQRMDQEEREQEERALLLQKNLQNNESIPFVQEYDTPTETLHASPETSSDNSNINSAIDVIDGHLNVDNVFELQGETQNISGIAESKNNEQEERLTQEGEEETSLQELVEEVFESKEASYEEEGGYEELPEELSFPVENFSELLQEEVVQESQ